MHVQIWDTVFKTKEGKQLGRVGNTKKFQQNNCFMNMYFQRNICYWGHVLSLWLMVWKLKNFSVTLILREIKVGEFRV